VKGRFIMTKAEGEAAFAKRVIIKEHAGVSLGPPGPRREALIGRLSRSTSHRQGKRHD